jgi:hypothetical protein
LGAWYKVSFFVVYKKMPHAIQFFQLKFSHKVTPEYFTINILPPTQENRTVVVKLLLKWG